MHRIGFVLVILLTACSHLESRHTEWAMTSFIKADSANPILKPDSSLVFLDPILQDSVRWAQKDVFNPAAVVRHDTVFLLLRAEDTVGKHAGTSRLGLAWSIDGLHFSMNRLPVLYPEVDKQLEWEWDGGCEDPRLVQDENGTYFLTYTAYDGTKARLFVASSTDLLHWTKYGSAFEGKYASEWSKSGSIVSSYASGTPVAKKINGKYWMYFGDQNIWIANSDDLIHWTPVLDKTNQKKTEMELRGIAKNFPELKVVIAPRPKKFDSDLVESGPPALFTDKGIVLLYNSRNIPSIGDKSLVEGTYAAGQALMDRNDPTKQIDRLENYFISPDKPYELSGQVNHVCFLEGLVHFKGKWFLYYGTADSKIAAAVRKE
ncbi:MAG: glycoside hydrolase family 130 protein [Flavisolibacter sp.]